MAWWNTIPQFWQAAIFVLLMFGILQAIDFYIKRYRLQNDGGMTEQEKILQDRVSDLSRRLDDSENKNQELENNQSLLLSQLRMANIKIGKQEDKIIELNDKVRELERVAPITPVEVKPFAGRVLGVWPDSLPLDTEGEKSAVSKTGLEYDALEGIEASREGIVEQLGLREYSILEIGAKGGGIGIKLADGIAPPTWWAKLAREHHIDIFIVLANESSKPGIDNIADALFNAGVKYVVSVDNSITDIDAVKFAHMFYRRLSRGVPIAKAVDYAKLVITDSGSDTIKLRERK